jgi:hypothetical protein
LQQSNEDVGEKNNGKRSEMSSDDDEKGLYSYNSWLAVPLLE